MKELPQWCSLFETLVSDLLKEAEGEGGSPAKVPVPVRTHDPKRGEPR